MLPLNDTEPNRYSFFPIMTVLLIVVNCFIFYVEPFIVDNYWEFLMKFGTTPVLILETRGGGALSNITTMFYMPIFFTCWVTCCRCGCLADEWRTLVVPGGILLFTYLQEPGRIFYTSLCWTIHLYPVLAQAGRFSD